MSTLLRLPNALLCAAVFVLATGCRSGPQLMPTPNAYVLEPDGVLGEVPVGLRSNIVDVLYVTDRAPTSSQHGMLTYGHRRSRSVAFGRCFVSIGKDVPWETLVEDSRRQKRSERYPIFPREAWELGRFPETPHRVREQDGQWEVDQDTLREEDLVRSQLEKELNRRLALTPRKEVVVFVHGFNNSFAEAVVRTAELWHFLQREGVAIAYTWPAGIGGLRGYGYDRESGEFTVHHLKQFLKILLSCGSVEKVHVLAHSRGADVLTSALRELAIEARGTQGPLARLDRLANLVLIAPDLDLDVAGQRLGAEHLQLVVERTTIYACQEDRAITLSNWLFEGFRRLGIVAREDLTPSERAALGDSRRVAVVDVQGRAGFLSHGYFHENPAASSDLILLLRGDCDPGSAGCRPLVEQGDGFWELRKEYPGSAE